MSVKSWFPSAASTCASSVTKKKTKNVIGHKNWNIWKAFLLISTILWYFYWGFPLNIAKTKNIIDHKNWNIWKAFLLISTILWYFNWGFSLNIAIWKTKITSETEKFKFFPLLCSFRLWNNLLVFSVLILTLYCLETFHLK